VLNVGAGGAVKDVDVRITSLTHPFVGDLRIELTSPSGTTVLLANRTGGAGDNFTNTVFDDEAAVAISSGTAPFTGSFRPQGDQLSRLDGEPLQGTWTLKVADLANLDIGTLDSWGHGIALGVCDFVPPPAPGQPSGLVATPGPDSVALDWSDVPSATGYEVFRRSAGGSYSEVPTALPGSSDFVDGGRTPGQQYCYVVGATTGGTPGPASSEACATIPGGPGGGGPDDGGSTGPPVLDLSSLKSRIRVGAKRRFTVTFAGTPGEAGSIRLTTIKAVAAQSRKRKLVVARRSFSVPAGGRARLELKVTRKGFRVLKRVRRLPVSARVTLGQTSAKKRATLLAPRPRPRR
jgi:subtilisin-like proprotein convertase family protein